MNSPDLDGLLFFLILAYLVTGIYLLVDYLRAAGGTEPPLAEGGGGSSQPAPGTSAADDDEGLKQWVMALLVTLGFVALAFVPWLILFFTNKRARMRKKRLVLASEDLDKRKEERERLAKLKGFIAERMQTVFSSVDGGYEDEKSIVQLLSKIVKGPLQVTQTGRQGHAHLPLYEYIETRCGSDALGLVTQEEIDEAKRLYHKRQEKTGEVITNKLASISLQ
jgi:hypothetical protein